MVNNDIQDLLKAIRLSTSEHTGDALSNISNINATTSNGTGILHFFIEIYKPEHLRLEDFKKLIKIGADVNAQNSEGHTPLHYTVLSPYSIDLARILIQNNAIVDIGDAYGNTQLMNAISDFRGEEELLQIIFLLLENGANINRANNSGISPKDVILRRQKNVLTGRTKKEWDLSEHLSAYLK